MARALVRGIVVALVGSLLLLPAGPAKAVGEVEIDVPPGPWSGVETITFTSSDPAVLSFAVQFVRSEGSVANVTLRAPNSTPGTPVEIEVPTWGHHGPRVVRAGACDTLDDPCDPSETFPRTIEQDPADAVTADFDLPEEPVFLPEEEDAATVTLRSPGGDLFLIRRSDGGTLFGPIASGASTPIPFPTSSPGGAVPFDVARCPEGRRPPVATIGSDCEVFDLRTVTFLRDLDLSAYTSSVGAVLHPTDGTSVTLIARSYVPYPDPRTFAYELVDAGGDTLVGPVTWSGSESVVFDPNATGVPLANGDYTLKVSVSVSKGDLLKESTESLPLALTSDPPAVDLPDYSIAGIDRDVRGTDPAFVSIEGTNDVRFHGTLHITDADGQEVWTRTERPNCYYDRCTTDPDPDEPAWYDFAWPGTTTTGGALPAGEYRAVMTVVDTWGRTVEVIDVGSLHINHLATVSETVRYVPQENTWSHSTIGQCSWAPSPGPNGWAGSVAVLSLSRCTSTAGKHDWAFRSFRFVHEGADLNRLISYRVGVYGAPVRAGMKGGIVYNTGTPEGWVNKGTLSGGLGWHDAQVHTVPVGSQNGNLFDGIVQARTTMGNQWDIKFWRVTWTYRAWRR